MGNYEIPGRERSIHDAPQDENADGIGQGLKN